MKDGYLTCACASFPVALADVNHNKNEILKIIEEVFKDRYEIAGVSRTLFKWLQY